jgi:rare lipoprotein A (peptidoglycan hydrolase)
MSAPKLRRLKIVFRRPVLACSLAALICGLAATGALLLRDHQQDRRAQAEARSKARAEEREQREQPPDDARHAERTETRERRELPGRIVNATWYLVPPDSVAKRRAGDHELTAAHDSLPLGTRVRVTHLANGRSVVVRITDRGIRNRRIALDLCKEAAEELAMLDEGVARVRMQVLADEPSVASAADSSSSAEP